MRKGLWFLDFSSNQRLFYFILFIIRSMDWVMDAFFHFYFLPLSYKS
ncbi:hypothetical protein P872_22440 [Rhodonellum psychrophilum GCM71 = DSM 17998]|uniref:Uncharacterized protein n=1 Tax=Rhodonellum psychrophilum GCM71 = DSM 17998 TaxID=1123057 RepID=U5C9F1_9BACT|nr:hypothetical protein P872_22440 [Rhodonellum psychrophilum GCM71 = DSM 17998]